MGRMENRGIFRHGFKGGIFTAEDTEIAEILENFHYEGHEAGIAGFSFRRLF